MIESKFGFFEVQVEGTPGHAIELGQAPLRKAPEGLDTVDMPFTVGELILPMMHSEVLVKADIDQPVITAPTVRVDHRAGFHMSANNGLQRGFGAIRHDLGIDLAVPLQQAEHDRLAVSAATSFATHAVRAKVRFIHFYRAMQRRLQLAGLGDASAYLEVNVVDRSDRKTGQFRRAHGREIERKTSHKLPEFGFADFRTAVIPVFTNHLRKLSHLNRCFAS